MQNLQYEISQGYFNNCYQPTQIERDLILLLYPCKVPTTTLCTSKMKSQEKSIEYGQDPPVVNIGSIQYDLDDNESHPVTGGNMRAIGLFRGGNSSRPPRRWEAMPHFDLSLN